MENWNKLKPYSKGTTVTHNGRIYQANTNTMGTIPTEASSWTDIGEHTDTLVTHVEDQNNPVKQILNRAGNGSVIILHEHGHDGKDGENGIQGFRGPKGEQGLQGIQGISGAKGNKGDKGDAGEQGLKGDKGERGLQGPAGEVKDRWIIGGSGYRNKITKVGTGTSLIFAENKHSTGLKSIRGINGIAITDNGSGTITIDGAGDIPIAQTPWLSNINGAGFYLYNTAGIYDANATPRISVNPGLRGLAAADGSYAILWNSRTLTNSGNIATLDWGNKLLLSGGVTCADWAGRILYATGGQPSNDWGERTFIDGTGQIVFSYSGSSDSITPLVWDNVEFGFIFNSNILDTSNQAISANFNTRQLSDSSSDLSIDYNAHKLYSGVTLIFDYSTLAKAKSSLGIGTAGSYAGTGTATTSFVVTIGATQPNNTYKVTVEPTNVLSTAVQYISAKTTNTFTVTYLAGLTGAVAFDWVLTP